ncbi:MAG: dienelactone hydrolase family protein [Chloroflexi bacterium]|nr:dienelactone hydrolase family protein [Chloroflexota bacterium]
MNTIEQVVDVDTPGGAMAVVKHRPDAAGPHLAMIVIMEAFGLNDNIAGIAKRFAEQGYVAVAPDLFHRSGRMKYAPYDKLMEYREELRKGFSDATILSDVSATVRHLQADPNVSGPIGIVGFCLGGRVAYMSAASVEGIAAAASFYPGNMFPEDGSYSAVDDAARITVPMLGCFGEDDQNPSPEIVEKIDSALSAHGVEHSFHSYAGAGHGFFCDDRDSYRPEAAEDAWVKTLAFFSKELSHNSPS